MVVCGSWFDGLTMKGLTMRLDGLTAKFKRPWVTCHFVNIRGFAFAPSVLSLRAADGEPVIVSDGAADIHVRAEVESQWADSIVTGS